MASEHDESKSTPTQTPVDGLIMVHDNGVKELTAERQKHKEDCSTLAVQAAAKSAMAALAVAGAGVFAANTFLPPFRRAVGTSGKAALVVRR